MFKHLLCNNIEIRRISGSDGYGNKLIEEEKTIKGKLEFEIQKVTNSNGDEIVSTGQLRALEQLSNLDQIRVNNVWRDVINTIPQDDFSGKVQYYIMYF